jgi:pSer/pThr/pTyr-binding forkhead associated (FHA) protein
LSFPKGEHQDVIVQPGEVTIGSAPDNAVVLGQGAVQPHHVSIIIDQRGFTMFVKDTDAQTHVNARPVREIAILHLGDVVSLDAVNMVLKPDRDDNIRPPAAGSETMANQGNGQDDTRYRQIPPKAVLRGVSGPLFGKIVAIQGRLVIGRGEDCDLVLDEPEMSRKHAMIEINQTEIYLRDLGSANGTFVNGVQVRDAQLHTGDQLAFDRNRFLVEAPGMPQRKPDAINISDDEPAHAPPQVTQTMRAIRIEPPAAASSAAAETPAPANSSWSPWWLLAAALLIAIGLALLFLGLR